VAGQDRHSGGAKVPLPLSTRHFSPALLAPRLSSQFRVRVAVSDSSECDASLVSISDNSLTDCRCLKTVSFVLFNYKSYCIIKKDVSENHGICRRRKYSLRAYGGRTPCTLWTTRRGHQSLLKGRRGCSHIIQYEAD